MQVLHRTTQNGPTSHTMGRSEGHPTGPFTPPDDYPYKYTIKQCATGRTGYSTHTVSIGEEGPKAASPSPCNESVNSDAKEGHFSVLSERVSWEEWIFDKNG
mmetsp:Transcript_42801/g.110375  ORF Transcript_42801/g.110375 Transcript_42801/m.110375 type:complete len:102 (-) Transcript_42801:1166-1471(-)